MTKFRPLRYSRPALEWLTYHIHIYIFWNDTTGSALYEPSNTFQVVKRYHLPWKSASLSARYVSVCPPETPNMAYSSLTTWEINTCKHMQRMMVIWNAFRFTGTLWGASCCIKLPTFWLFVPQSLQASNNGNTKALHYALYMWGHSTSNQWLPSQMPVMESISTCRAPSSGHV